MRFVRVAVPVPALDALTYRVPEEFRDPAPGVRVVVPLGSRMLTGCVISADHGNTPDFAIDTASSPDDAIRPLADVLDDDPFLPQDVLELAVWTAEYYACGIGEVVAAALPPRAWVESDRVARITDLGHARLLTERGARRALLEKLSAGKEVRAASLTARQATLLALERDGLVMVARRLRGAADASRTVRVARVTAQGLGVPDEAGDSPALRLGPRQREALRLLRGAPDGLETSALAAAGVHAPALARLAALGLIAIARHSIERDPFGAEPAPPPVAMPLDLTREQAAALRRLREHSEGGRFGAVLLHGVTGSGKTEIYLRLAADIVAGGRGVLLLVPEIALTPAIAAAFRSAFGGRVAIQHSGLSDGERYDQWHRIRRGDIAVVVGTRSAVFAPLRTPGLLIVDEEHDGSYKQEETPRYNGRDVAVMRARQAGALVVLGSATPAMESYQNALAGRYHLVKLESRVLNRPLPDVTIVNMREEYATEGPDVILSRPLRDALGERLARGEQAIILLNRRGFASAVFCRQCAATLECPNCSVSLTVHRAERRARCHYCNYAMRLPSACLNCAGPYLEQIGFGTQRVEEELLAAFPQARVARVDRDSVRRRGAVAAVLGRFAAGDIDVLVGTQMIAKGHDFPKVTLAGVISADVGLGHADFRAAERTFQLLTQVAGRAGRGEVSGRAIVQTLYPEHYSIRHACRQDYAAFFEEELRFRAAMRYPPAVALVNVVVKGRSRPAAMADAGEIARALRWGGAPYRVLGPAIAPLSRIRGEHRAQLFLKGTHRGAMRRAVVSVLADRPEIRRRTIVDVDPMSVL